MNVKQIIGKKLNKKLKNYEKMEKKIDKLITEYENIWNSGRFDLSIEKVTQDLHKLKAELKEQHKKDIYSGELNTKRIAEYSKLEQLYNLERTTIGNIFCKGADWMNKVHNENH